MNESEQELAKIQEAMPTPFMPVRYSSRLLRFLAHYHKVWLRADAEGKEELQKSLKTLTAILYDWVG